MPGTYITFATADGYWDVVVSTEEFNAAHVVNIELPKLPDGPWGWWHRELGIDQLSGSRGAGVRIGIIDEALDLHEQGSCIGHVRNDSDAWSSERSERAHTPLTEHASAVCALIASRALEAKGFAGVAPDAEVFFAAAGTEANPTLFTPRVVSCIDYLVERRNVDILSISAGDLPEAAPSIANAAAAAADAGVLCFVAAGNERGVKYPALYPECLAVAALGKIGQAPAGSAVALSDQLQSELLQIDDLYLWSNSARGLEVEFCAPGVGVIWSRNGNAAAAAVGTSFACPLAAGVAAVLLSRDREYLTLPRNRERYERAIQVLVNSSDFLGIEAEGLWKYGFIRM